MAGKGPKAFAWLLLRKPLPGGSALERSLCKSLVVCRQFAYRDNRGAMLVRGPVEEIDRILRLVRSENFHPDIVLDGHRDALPLPRFIWSPNRSLGSVG